MGISRNDFIDERGRIYCKRSWDSRGCARYRRPAMRLARSGKRTLAGRTSAPLIAEGILSHILQECRAKALATEGNATADSLYGSGVNASVSGETLFCNASNFEGSIALKERAGGHRRSISPTTPLEMVAEEEQVAASARGPDDDAANDKTSDSVPEVDANTTDFQLLPEEKPTHQSESRADNTQPVPEPVPEAGANDAQSLRTNTIEIGVQVGDAILPNEASLSDGEAEPSREGSSNTLPPFTFMPGPPRRPSTPVRASSASLEAIFLQNADLYTCKSPIRPRTSKCPIMLPVDSPLSLYGLKCISSSSTDRGTSTTAQCPSPTSSHPSAAALPFDFISVRNPTTISNVSDLSRGAPDPPAGSTPAPSGCLDSLMRHIFAFAAKWLPKLNPTSSAGPDPPSSSDSTGDSPSTHLQRAIEPLPDRTDAPQDHRSTLLPPPSVVRSHSLRPNDHPNEAEDERSSASQSSGPNIATAHHVRSASAFSTPPRGWEQLFQPKAGEWKCEACYFINPSEALTCDSCTELKDAPLRTNSSDVDDTTSGGNGGEAVREDSARLGGSSTEERNNDTEAPTFEENESGSEEEPDCDDISPSKRIKVSAPTPAKARRTALLLSDEESESSEEEEEQEVSPSKRIKVSAPTPAKASRAAPTPAKALRATTLFESVEEEEEEEREVSPSKRVKVGGGVSPHLNINATQPAVGRSLEVAPSDDVSPSKRIRRDSGANGGNAAQSIFGHSPDALLKMAQKRGKKSGSGKRMKVDLPNGLGGDVYASGVSANAFGSTKPCDGALNQQSTTMPRGDVDGLAMDESLSYSFSTEETVMEVESPRGSTMSFS